MILAFKKSGWLWNKKVRIFTSSLNSSEHTYYELPALKKYNAAVIMDVREMKRLRDFINEELNNYAENYTNDK